MRTSNTIAGVFMPEQYPDTTPPKRNKAVYFLNDTKEMVLAPAMSQYTGKEVVDLITFDKDGKPVQYIMQLTKTDKRVKEFTEYLDKYECWSVL